MESYRFEDVTVRYQGEVIAHIDTSGPGQGPDVLLMPGETYRLVMRLLRPLTLPDWSMPPVVPRKHWVMDQDWKQRLPRHRRRR